MPKCTINGEEVEVKDGTTVIEAFKKTGQDICHYCWHPGLSIAGVCRLCMVEIEGNPRLQIGCNTVVQEGMAVNNQSEQVKDAVRWGLDFHLINHPLDCPICDQAGECGLQDQYMKFGKYDPEMAERKVKKRKVVDLGPKIILDTERCILCSRCVRFTDEVSKTHELGIFNRGDRSEIGTFEDKPLDNNYSINTVDICPVGALTSKDFRFKQRVWYLEETETTCPGCSTGCKVTAFHNEEGVWRLRPAFDEEVNGYWMCDKGRDAYKYVNRKTRLLKAKYGRKGDWEYVSAGMAAKEAGAKLQSEVKKNGADSVALVLTGQYTNEEYSTLLDFFVNKLGSKNVYHWQNNPEQAKEFDGLLYRGDRNPNTRGLTDALSGHSIKSNWLDLEQKIKSNQLKAIVVAGPEDQSVFPDIDEKLDLLMQTNSLVWLTAGFNKSLDNVSCMTWQIPTKTFVEKNGTFTNYDGKKRTIQQATTVIAGALKLDEAAVLFSGEDISLSQTKSETQLKTNHYVYQRGSL